MKISAKVVKKSEFEIRNSELFRIFAKNNKNYKHYVR